MSTLKRLTSALNLKEGLDPTKIKYLSMRISKLNPKDKLVKIAMDEVYTKQTLELAGGGLYGDSEKGITNTLFCAYISSVAGNYQDLVTMSPVPHLKSDDIKDIFFKVLKNLTELGFVVVTVTTDGHRTNQSFHSSLGTEGVYPEYTPSVPLDPFSGCLQGSKVVISSKK